MEYIILFLKGVAALMIGGCAIILLTLGGMVISAIFAKKE